MRCSYAPAPSPRSRKPPIGWTAHLWREGRLYGRAPVLRLTVEPDGSAGCYDLRHDALPLEVAP